jgi:protein-tyrosine phosphatase
MENDDQLYMIARVLRAFMHAGKVLCHCQAGLNRSSLISGLALILDGYEPEEAIRLLRTSRSPAVLCNGSFERWLLKQPTGGAEKG